MNKDKLKKQTERAVMTEQERRVMEIMEQECCTFEAAMNQRIKEKFGK